MISANDSGGANQIYYWYLKNIKKYHFYFYLSGPAKKIFNKKNITKKKLRNLVFDRIITGTSINSDTEKKIRFYFKKHKRVIAFLDHYINYKVRFFYNGDYFYPNEIWCLDKYSLLKCKNIFKNIKIKLIKNYYKTEFLNYIKKQKHKNSVRLKALYLSEPFLNKKYKANEKEIIKKLIKFLKVTSTKILTIRLHPSEKFMRFITLKKMIASQYKIKVKLDKNKTLFNSLINNKFIIGIESYALVISVLGKKRTFSLLPYKKFKSSLPYKSIVSVNNYI